ncbi:RimK family alpha-L-glutamate ligase [Sphingomonas sp. MMS24-J45]|uniref:ATP-grasp domain-containing protein n=1 Tax=Sphingomonas sp. MMS24-J45 TaxID=3238806 RepID=UPI00384DFA80
MHVRVDLLMPVAGSPYDAVAADLAVPFVTAFTGAGVALTPRPWDLGPGDADATLALFAWGYHFDVARWEALLDAWPADQPLFNPPALLRWNTRKTYLQELATAGVPIVPSHFGRADDASVAAAFDAFACDELVVKPQVSAGSHHTVRIRRGEAVTPLGDAILQPLLPAIAEEGELSLFAIGGRFSHAARKVATGGDFRIQPQFGGRFTRYDPDAEAMAVFDAALAALPHAPLYARIDLLRRADGRLALIEVEAIEPDLYSDLAPDAPHRLATALSEALR